MKCIVCISQTPDTATKIALAADGLSINPAGVKFILNPYDEFAVEEALRCREKFGGEVVVVSVGGDSAKEAMKTALAMGADTGILVKDALRTDAFGVAVQLAEVIRTAKPDMVFCGRQSVDYDGFQIGPMIAELTGMPCVSMVVSLTIDGTKIVCDREIEGGRETVEASMPCIVTAQKGLNEPRYPSLPNIMKAKSKPIAEVAATTSEPRTQVVAMRKPESKRLGKILTYDDKAVSTLVKLLHEEAKVF